MRSSSRGSCFIKTSFPAATQPPSTPDIPHGCHLHRRDRFCFGPECQTSVITPGHHGVICIACLPEGGDQKVGHGFAKGLHRLPPAPVSQSGLGSHVHLMCGLRQEEDEAVDEIHQLNQNPRHMKSGEGGGDLVNGRGERQQIHGADRAQSGGQHFSAPPEALGGGAQIQAAQPELPGSHRRPGCLQHNGQGAQQDECHGNPQQCQVGSHRCAAQTADYPTQCHHQKQGNRRTARRDTAEQQSHREQELQHGVQRPQTGPMGQPVYGRKMAGSL